MEEKELNGLNYEKLFLNHNVHKIRGKVEKHQNNQSIEVGVDDGAIWLVAGLGYLKEETPELIIQESLDDIIIVSKSQLIDFLRKNNEKAL
jgi:hypothetical protein